MLYTVASAEWTAKDPLTPAETMAGLFRTRAEASQVGDGAGLPTLAVAVTYDSSRGVVVARPPGSFSLQGSWTAPAIQNDAGGVVVLKAIPATLVRLVGRPQIRIHPGESRTGPHVQGHSKVGRLG